MPLSMTHLRRETGAARLRAQLAVWTRPSSGQSNSVSFAIIV